MTLADLPSPNIGPGPGFWIVCSALGVACGTLWGIIKLSVWFMGLFPRMAEHVALKAEVHELRVRVATIEKIDGKIDRIIVAVESRRRVHD